MKVLITGANGFVAKHLATYIRKEENPIIIGIDRWRLKEEITDFDKVVECDLTDAWQIGRLLEEERPDVIFHLAAQSFVPTSFDAPSDTLVNNITAQLNLFEAIRKIKGYEPIIQIAGSSEEYGLVLPNEVPIKETNPLRPLSPYGVSKVTQDRLAYQYHKSYGLNVVITRAFNHTGPGRPECFVCSSFAKQFAEIKKLKKNEMKIGNLDSIRDFTDVRDMVRAYWLAIFNCNFGEVYNISSDKGVQIKDILKKLEMITGETPEYKTDVSKQRPSDVMILVGNSKKFRKATKWKPEIPFEQTLKDMYYHWLEKI